MEEKNLGLIKNLQMGSCHIKTRLQSKLEIGVYKRIEIIKYLFEILLEKLFASLNS